MHYDEIRERLQRVVGTPAKPIPPEALERERERFYKIHEKSLALFEEAKQYIPGGVEHNLATSKPFPLAMDRARGYRMWDIDGNEFVDYLMCGAPIILGHHYDPLDDEVIEVIREKGPSTGLTSEFELLAAKKIIEHMPSVDRVRFLQSGTEADMAALRIARAYTDRTKVIKVEGSYHGWYDTYVMNLHIPGTGGLNSKGIPPAAYADLVEVKPNDFDGLEKAFEDNQGEIAAMVLEPVGGESGVHPVHPDWNRRCRELCTAHGALLDLRRGGDGLPPGHGGGAEIFRHRPRPHRAGQDRGPRLPLGRCGGGQGRDHGHLRRGHGHQALPGGDAGRQPHLLLRLLPRHPADGGERRRG